MRRYFPIILIALGFLGVAYSNAFSATPKVIETHPPDGAVGVRPDLDRIVIKYDQPVNAWVSRIPEHNCFQISPEWATDPVPGDFFWGDRIIIPRDIVAHVDGDPDWQDLPYGTVIDVTINPQGAASDYCFQDMDGNLLPTHHLRFTIRAAPDDPPMEPYVVSANPPDGATGVDPNIGSFSLTFSEPMAPNDKGYFSNFGPTALAWSADGKTLTFTRQDTSPLSGGYDVVFILNYDDDDRFRDLDGHVLKEYTYTFRIAGDLQSSMEKNYGMKYLKVPADPTNGFYWPYYLGIPDGLSGLTTLLVVPNNSGRPCDDQRFHEIMARWTLYGFSRLASSIQVPMLVPVFPRTTGAYLQNLSGIAFRSDLLSSSLERIDLQLLAMIGDAADRLSERPIYIEDKVFMTGFSASGQFTNGFAIIHPDSVKAAAAGGGENAIAPVAVWNGEEMRYFWGVADLEELTGRPFDLENFVEIPLFFYLGDLDANYTNCPECFERSEEIYESVNASSTFKLYTDMGHWINEEAWSDLESFFGDFSPDPTGIWVTLSGTVSNDGQPLCAMVLANGQSMFTCGQGDDLGKYTLNVPLDANGKITLYSFCSGFSPYNTILATGTSDLEIAMSKDQEGEPLFVTVENISDSPTKSGWYDMSGTIEDASGTPLCAMALANGERMFTCGNSLGRFDLTVPLDGDGKITLHTFVSGFKPYKKIIYGPDTSANPK
ncbi:MAG: Ig-like domain-containing protein [Desulfatiglandales bacterium]